MAVAVPLTLLLGLLCGLVLAMRITRSIVQRDFDTTAFLVAAVFYLFFTFILTKVFGYLEKRYAVYDE